MSKNQHLYLPRTIRVDEAVYEHLKEWAAAERRSVSNLLGIIIETSVKDRVMEKAQVERVNS